MSVSPVVREARMRACGAARRLAVALVVLTAPAALTACTAPSAGSPTESEGPPAAGWDRLPDGTHSGFVDGIEGEAMTFSPAAMISDDDAPNGFRIEATDTDALLLRVAPSATGVLIDNVAVNRREVDLATLDAFLDGDPLSWAYGSPDFFLVEIEVHDGEVLTIEEVYLP
jgi:hypothetical protein